MYRGLTLTPTVVLSFGGGGGGGGGGEIDTNTYSSFVLSFGGGGGRLTLTPTVVL